MFAPIKLDGKIQATECVKILLRKFIKFVKFNNDSQALTITYSEIISLVAGCFKAEKEDVIKTKWLIVVSAKDKKRLS